MKLSSRSMAIMALLLMAASAYAFQPAFSGILWLAVVLMLLGAAALGGSLRLGCAAACAAGSG